MENIERIAVNIHLNIFRKTSALKSTPDKIRTCNRLIRSQVLYPVELRVQGVINEHRISNIE